jgi:hypothetical protein
MLIASDFYDFYDSIQVFGIDKTCVYQRVRKELKGAFVFGDESRKSLRSNWPSEEDFSGRKIKLTASKYVIGFCGKLYPMILVEKQVAEKKQVFGLYSAQEVKEYFGANKALSTRFSYYSMRYFSVKSEAAMKQFFEGAPFKSLEEEFHKHKVPTFVYGRFPGDKYKSRELLVLNPRLKAESFWF